MCCGSCRGGFFIKRCRSNQNNKVVLILWLKLREKIFRTIKILRYGSN
nr:MAG TPA: hypothetical protein [Caudoviricetes sp.]